MGTVEAWAKFISKTNYGDIPQPDIRVAVEHILDTTGVILAGAADPIGQIALKHAREQGAGVEAGVLGSAIRTTAANAAFANGILGHCMDYDDAWIIKGHPSITLVPTILALGEKTHASGKDAIAAYVIGMEIMGRLVMALGPHFHRAWHTTAIWGTIGSCAAASKLLGLNETQTRMAFGIACSGSAGLHKNAGTMTKAYHAGNANRNGITAALMAKEGFGADPEIIEGVEGFATAFTGKEDLPLEKIPEGLGKPFTVSMMRPGLCIKKYACGFIVHWPLDAILDLIKEHKIKADDVDSVEVGIRHNDPLDDPRVVSRLKAKFSMQYNMAAAIVDGAITRGTYDEDRTNDPAIRAMMARVKAKEYPLPEDFPATRNHPVTITMKDGRTLSKKVDKPRGFPDVPVRREELLGKYRDCASAVLPAKKVEESVKQLEALADVTDLASLVRSVTL